MTMTKWERRQIRHLADELRQDNPRLARVLARRGLTTRWRIAYATVALGAGIALMAYGSVFFCIGSLAADLVAVLLLRPITGRDD